MSEWTCVHLELKTGLRWLLAQALVTLAVVSPAAADPAPPAASFDYSPPAPSAGQAVTFDASASSGGSEPVASYRWDFGDGSVQTYTGPLATHTYALPGSYTVTLTVTAQGGRNLSDTASGTLTVSASPQPPSSPPSTADCGDGADNDADGQTDYPADHGCGSASDPTEAGPTATIAAGLVAPSSTAFLTPFPVVRIVGSLQARGSRIRLLAVRAPGGSTIEVRCRGTRCPRSRQEKRVQTLGRVTFRRFHRYLPAGTALGIYARKPGYVGKYTRFRIRDRRRPARVDRCLLPGNARPVSCPTSSPGG